MRPNRSDRCCCGADERLKVRRAFPSSSNRTWLDLGVPTPSGTSSAHPRSPPRSLPPPPHPATPQCYHFIAVPAAPQLSPSSDADSTLHLHPTPPHPLHPITILWAYHPTHPSGTSRTSSTSYRRKVILISQVEIEIDLNRYPKHIPCWVTMLLGE